MTSPALEVLTTVREALSDPERWYQGSYFNGKSTESATCACLEGATWIAAEALYGSPATYDKPADWLISEAAGRPVIDFNDDPSTTHADILAVLDRAIELAKEEEG